MSAYVFQLKQFYKKIVIPDRDSWLCEVLKNLMTPLPGLQKKLGPNPIFYHPHRNNERSLLNLFYN